MKTAMTEKMLIHIFKKVSLYDLSECEFESSNDEDECWVNAVKNGTVIDAIYYDGNLFKMMDNGGGFALLNPMCDAFKAMEEYASQPMSAEQVEERFMDTSKTIFTSIDHYREAGRDDEFNVKSIAEYLQRQFSTAPTVKAEGCKHNSSTKDETTPSSQHDAKLPLMCSYLTNAEANKIVECCECGYKHKKGDRVGQKQTEHRIGYLCPQCGYESYYDCP